MRSFLASLLVSPVLILSFVSPVFGQSWGDIIKGKAAQHAVSAADRTIDQGQDATDRATRCVVTDQACIDQARQHGNEVVVTNKKGLAPSSGISSPSLGPQPAPANQSRSVLQVVDSRAPKV